ncbi:MAG: DUF177 domain-containing protein [Saprospiraceae bacterium]|nr:DUF177 domain-containing protein [Saprospiraceae bacterium]
MDAFVAYSIPIQGLKYGVHRFAYDVDKAFFAHFEGSPLEEAEVHVDLALDKRSDMLLLDFALQGTVRTECDRCTAPIRLPVNDQRQLVVKYGDANGEAEDEVVFIQRETHDFNVAKYLYEFTVLAMPYIRAYDCENDDPRPCNMEVLEHLQNIAREADYPAWDALKDFKEKP